jgi:hypothetical protein
MGYPGFLPPRGNTTKTQSRPTWICRQLYEIVVRPAFHLMQFHCEPSSFLDPWNHNYERGIYYEGSAAIVKAAWVREQVRLQDQYNYLKKKDSCCEHIR